MKLFVKAALLLALFFHLLLLSSLTTRLDEVTSRWIAAASRMSETDARSVAPWERRVSGPIAEEDITLCIKTYARPGCLSRLLRTVRARYPLMPIIVADDSAEPAALPFGGVELMELSARTGCAFGRNMLVQRVRTPYLIFMDDDMYPDDSLDLLKWVERVRELKVDLVAATVEDATYVPRQHEAVCVCMRVCVSCVSVSGVRCQCQCQCRSLSVCLWLCLSLCPFLGTQ